MNIHRRLELRDNKCLHDKTVSNDRKSSQTSPRDSWSSLLFVSRPGAPAYIGVGGKLCHSWNYLQWHINGFGNQIKETYIPSLYNPACLSVFHTSLHCIVRSLNSFSARLNGKFEINPRWNIGKVRHVTKRPPTQRFSLLGSTPRSLQSPHVFVLIMSCAYVKHTNEMANSNSRWRIPTNDRYVTSVKMSSSCPFVRVDFEEEVN